MNPLTATDAEVDAWLAEHCHEAHNQYKAGWTVGEIWHPTSDYDQLVLCEAKVSDRWRLRLAQLPPAWAKSVCLETYECMADPWGDDTVDDEVHVFSRHASELSARARLVVATLQWEAEHE